MLPSISREKAGLAPPRCLVLVSLDVYATSLMPRHLDMVTLWKWQGILRRVCRVWSVGPAIPAPRRMRQDLEFDTSLGYMTRLSEEVGDCHRRKHSRMVL